MVSVSSIYLGCKSKLDEVLFCNRRVGEQSHDGIVNDGMEEAKVV